MKALLMAAGAAMLLGGCATTEPDDLPPPALAADPMSPTSAPGYMQMAASSDMFEIESSRLALQMSRNQAVRSFAQMISRGPPHAQTRCPHPAHRATCRWPPAVTCSR